MYKLIYTVVFLLAALGASAQNMPERSEVRRGNRQYNKGNYEQSAGHYEQALQAAPGQFEAIYNLGNALYKAERFDRAEQTLRQAAADTLRPETELAEAYYNLGNAQFKQQKYKEALESYKQSLRLNPSDMEAKYNYAYTKRLLDQDQNGGGGNDQQNQDQNQDQDKQDQQKEQDKQQDQQKDQQQNQDQQQQQPSQPEKKDNEMSKENAEQLLNSVMQDEKDVQDKVKKQQVLQGGRLEKDW